MTTRPILVTTVGGLLGLALSWPFAQAYVGAGNPAGSPGTAGPGAGTVKVVPAHAGGSSNASPTAQSTAAAPASKQLVATGPVEFTQFGPVQVQATIVVTGSRLRIADITSLQLPAGGRSGSISSYAAPQLRQEALTAQSANVHTVSGASYTSDGYRRSLQAALDAGRKAAGL